MDDGMEEAGLPAARNEDTEALLAGIARVLAIINGGELTDSEEIQSALKITEIGDLLRKRALDPAIAACFHGDGKWVPEQQKFEGLPVWDCVRTALGILSTTVLEQNRAVHDLTTHAVHLCTPSWFACLLISPNSLARLDPATSI